MTPHGQIAHYRIAGKLGEGGMAAAVTLQFINRLAH